MTDEDKDRQPDMAKEREDAGQRKACGKVWFIGAGPGDPELVTVKGRRLIGEADLIIYAGSLVSPKMVAHAGKSARIEDSSGMSLEEILGLMLEYARDGKTVARVHTGDPGLFGAILEQMDVLDQEGIECEIVPGVTAAFATAAAARASLTVPETVQSFVITRLHGRTPVPEGQRVRDFARHKSSMAVYLSAAYPEKLAEELRAGGLSEDTPIVIGNKVTWPGGSVIWTTLGELEKDFSQAGISRQAIFLVLPGADKPRQTSKLYDKNFSHGFRN